MSKSTLVSAKRKGTERYFRRPVEPFSLEPSVSAGRLLEKMSALGFQGKNLGRAAEVWCNMLTSPRTIVFFGLAGAMCPAGMRRIMMQAIEHGMIDCLVSTGANLFHDTVESLGGRHYQGHHEMDDEDLFKHKIDRIYDVLGDEEAFRVVDDYTGRFAETLDLSRGYTTREFLNLMGGRLQADGATNGILATAFRHNVPVYVPALGDSSFGIGLAANRFKTGKRLLIDVVGDVLESALVAAAGRKTGVIYVGGGTPKNFVNQTEVTGDVMKLPVKGHAFALQITTDAPHWGGLSGCTFDEAISWGKIDPKATQATVHADATIALPILASAVFERTRATLPSRERPHFEMGPELRVSWGPKPKRKSAR